MSDKAHGGIAMNPWADDKLLAAMRKALGAERVTIERCPATPSLLIIAKVRGQEFCFELTSSFARTCEGLALPRVLAELKQQIIEAGRAQDDKQPEEPE